MGATRNAIKPETVARMNALLSQGLGTREVAAIIGCHKASVVKHGTVGIKRAGQGQYVSPRPTPTLADLIVATRESAKPTGRAYIRDPYALLWPRARTDGLSEQYLYV